MARSVSDEELQLKKRARRRLIGAVVLVTTVAVVLPMVLDSEPRPSNPSISIQIPAQDAGVIAKPPAPLKPADPVATAPAVAEARPDAVKPEAAAAVAKADAKAEPKAEVKTEKKAETKAEAKAKPEPVAKADTPVQPVTKPAAEPRKEDANASSKPSVPVPAETKTAEAKTASPAEVKPAETKAAKPDPAKPKDAEKSKSAGGYVIQIAALSDAAKAKELQAKLAGSGLKAYTEVVQTAKGPVTRVRVGPYASREAAEKARPQLQKLQLDGKVVPR
jgi:DedD protein